MYFRRIPSVPVILLVLLLAACAKPQIGIERTSMPGPTITAMLALPVTPSAQPATLTATLQATTELTFPTATSTPKPTPIEVPILRSRSGQAPVPTPQPTNTPISAHTRVSLTHKPAPVLHVGWSSYTDATYTGDLAFDHQGNLWAAGSGGVIRVDLKNRTYTSFTAEHGLTGCWVSAVAVAPDGSLWFGTSEGISHFDGRAWTTYTTEDGLADNCVESIGFAPNDEVWALGCPVLHGGKYGTDPGRLSRYDGRSWVSYQVGDSPAGEYALFLITAPDGALWLGTPDTISRFDGHAWTHTATNVPAGSGWPSWEAAVAPDGALWVAVEWGVARFDGQSWTTYTQADGLASDYVRAIAIAPDGVVWVGTQDNGVSRFDGQGWSSYTADDGLAGNQAESATVAPDGSVWFSTYEVSYQYGYGSLSFAGLSRFDGRTWTTYTTGGGLADNNVYSIAEAPDGVLWFGSGGGLSRFDGETWTTYTEDDGAVFNYVWSIAVASDGAVWASSGIAGLFGFDGHTWTTYDSVLGAVRSIVPVPDGGLWVGTSSGIYHFDGQTWTVYEYGAGHLESTVVTSIAFAPDGMVWIGTLDGLARFDRQATPDEAWATYTTADGLADDYVTCVAVASDGAVWAGTLGHGVSRFDGETWVSYTEEDGLVSNPIESIVVAPDGAVWVGGSGGVSHFDGQRWTTYSRADGLASGNGRAIAVTRDGTLWVGGPCGVSRYVPATPQDQYTPTPLSITAATTIPSPTKTATPIATLSSTPTITATAGLSLPVEALPMEITPGTLTLSAGDSACFNVSALANWDGQTLPSWSVDGLPPGAIVEFKGQTAGNPTSGCLRVDTPCSIAEGEYPLEVTSAVPGKMWKAQATLGIAPCEEFKPGVYTKSMDELMSVIVAGKPDFINGLAVPLQVCCGSQPRKLKVTIESATSEAGTPLAKPPRFYLFYSLVRPAPDFVDAHNAEFRNVEQDYMISSGWSLEEAVTPGLYLLVFEHDSYADLVNPREPSDVPKSVTYRLEVVPMPCTETVCLRAFTVSPQTVNPGEMVTLSWDVAGEVQEVVLWTLNPLGQLDTAHSDLPASGSLTLTVPAWRRNAMSFQLYASDPDGLWILADTFVKIACPDVWFFPNPPSDCPRPATYTKMAVQHFEHGVMIWTEWEDRIRVFYNDSQDVHLRRWEMRNNEWFPGMPESDPHIVPPPGYHQPVRGFGKLWREGSRWDGTSIRDLLGWAIDPEFAIDHGAVQCDTSPKYNTCYLGDPVGVVYVEEPELQGWYEWAGPNAMP